MSVQNVPDPIVVTAGISSPAHRLWSLAARLTAWYAGSAFCMVAVVTGCLYWALKHHFYTDEDVTLADQVQILRNHLEHAPDLHAMLKEEVVEEMAARHFAQVYVRILDAHGGTMIETPGMADLLACEVFPRPAPDVLTLVEGRQALDSHGDPFRIVSGLARISNQGIGTIQIALGNRYEQDLLARYRGWLAVLLILSFGASVTGGYLLARSGLRPLRRFSTAISEISSARLDKRIAVAGLPAELAAVGESFNAMLTRLEDAFDRLRRFSADIAHELRTPVNNLRGETEVALGRARSPEEYREVLASSLEECQRITGLIDTLLFLARAESPQQDIVRDHVDLRQEAKIVAHFYGSLADEAGIGLKVEPSSEAAVRGDRTLLQRAIGNLIENALAYTARGGQITLRFGLIGDQVTMTVTDTGCGIPAEHLPFVFDRFHRVEQVRSHSGGHVGLGLSIVRSIASLHGGTASIASVIHQGTSVTLSLPRDQTVMNGAVTPT